MEACEELINISSSLNEKAKIGLDKIIIASLESLNEAVNKVDKSFCKSRLGYHSCVYYRDFQEIPPGHSFSVEWGLKETYHGMGSIGDWKEYTYGYVEKYIYDIAGNPDVSQLLKSSDEIYSFLEDSVEDIVSIITNLISNDNDDYLVSIKNKIEQMKFLSVVEILNRMSPKQQVITRDSLALSQGFRTPPHERIRAELVYINNSTAFLVKLGKLASQASNHIQRKYRKQAEKKENLEIGFEDLLHDIIKRSSLAKYKDGHYRNAVLDAITAVFDYIRVRVGIDEDGDKLVNTVFSLTSPMLVLSEIETETGQNDQKGFMNIYRGAYQGIRNTKAHTLLHDLDANKAAQYLVFAILLARRIEDANKL